MRVRGLCFLNTVAVLSACTSGDDTRYGATTSNATSCVNATYEAEAMFHSTGGTTTGGWNIWSNGYISQSHDFATSQVTITVTAAGRIAAGVWPHMVVSVGGTAIGNVYVSTTSWAPYSFNYTATAGVQEIRVTYDNDYNANGEDRNLHVDKVDVTCAGPCGGPTGVVISTPLSLDKSSVAIGQTITGNVTFRNCNTSSTTLQQIVIAGRPPGGTHLGGPWLDFSPEKGSTTLASGETVSWTASRTMASTDPTGPWFSFATYQDTGGTWHDGPDVNFTVTPALPSACNGQSGLVLTTPLSLDKSSVAIGQTITGTATYTNCTYASLSVQQLVIGGRPPGGTHQGGPWLDFSPAMGPTTVASGASVTVTASRTMSSSDPTGQWYSFVTYADSGGIYHDGPDVYFTVTAGGGLPAGWLYTNGNKIYVSDGGGGGTQWMARGVNVDDVFFCGYNHTLWMSNPQTTLETVFSGLMSGWKPTFVRMSLGMSSYVDKDWITGDATYTTPTTNAINFLGSYPNVYVLVTLRSHSSMVRTNADNEATYIPTNATDATYRALVNTFANAKYVMFGISNEPGTISWSSLMPVMNHAVSVIRAEEDRLGVPHHIVAVQGRQWTNDISAYASSPLPYDNVVYEVHGYQPPSSSYTYSNIPVIIGEYGPASHLNTDTVTSTFLNDVEAKKIPNLAWTFEPYSNCTPSLLETTHNASSLIPTPWGTQVKNYLLSHAP
jgi:hypothetical protein